MARTSGTDQSELISSVAAPQRSSSLLAKARGAVKLLASSPNSDAASATGGGSKSSGGTKSSMTAWTIAPPSHRENTALHALMDTLPTLPTFSTPSMPSFFSNNSSSGPSSARVFEDDHGDSVVNSRVNDIKGDSSEMLSGTSSNSSSRRGSASIDDPIKRLTGAFVTLGGYRGSILRDAKTNRRLWVPFRTGFNIRKPDLALGLDDEDELNSTETIVPGKQLMQVGPIDLGKRLKDKLKALEASQAHSSALPASSTGKLKAPEASQVHSSSPPASSTVVVPAFVFCNHGYDWRRRLELSSAELLARLNALKAESAARGEGIDGKGEGATVLAHSMGGLVALHALATAPDPTVIKGMIFAGTPFHGTVNVLAPFRSGDSVIFNRDICSPSVVFSMRSSFYFLPFTGKCFETPTGESLLVDFYDPKSWSLYNLSPLTAGLYRTSMSTQDREEEKVDAAQASNIGMSGGLGMPAVGASSSPGMGVSRTRGITERLREHDRLHEGESTPLSGGGRLARSDSGRTIPIPPRETEGEIYNEAGEEAEEDNVELDAEGRPLRRGSANSTSSDEVPAASAAGQTGNSRSAQPEFPEMEKILSSSDQALSMYLTKTLSRVKQFYADITNGYDPVKAERGAYPPIVLLTSRRTPTVRGVIAPSRESIATEPYANLLWDEGDGIVLYSSASSLPGPTWNSHVKGIVESPAGHVSLVGDVNSVRRCLELLYDSP